MANELFTRIDRKVKDLLNDIQIGKIGLPDLQRPFVWPDTKTRDLLDSMMKGYPIGYVMLWNSPDDYSNTKTIGDNSKAYNKVYELVIDGQQRLTSLLASMNGIEIQDKNYKKRRIKIAFDPMNVKFEVWSKAYDNDLRWIDDISKVFEAEDQHRLSSYRKKVIENINAWREKKEQPTLTDDEEETLENNLKALLDLKDYTIPTLAISYTANEEDVAEIFKRVNSGGQKLNENNFIETLLAVYDNEVYAKINKFCSDSRIPQDGTSYNHIIKVETSHIIRMTVGYGFKRARLRYAYMILRGKDLETGVTTEEIRNENLLTFKKSLDVVTNLNNWHAFLNLFAEAGYLTESIISSKYAVVFSYVLYLIGKYEYKMSPLQINKIITKWIFMVTITGYYSNSTESTVENLFADLRKIETADDYEKYLLQSIDDELTEDFFTVTLPNNLESSAAISPAWFAYIASINILGTPMLFSNTPLSKYLTVGSSGTKNAIDKHHIFPKNYLEKVLGIEDDRDRNQIANFTYLDYATNIDISDKAPEEYIAEYRKKLGDDAFKLTCEQNALPENFETMDYYEFLEKRRILMSDIIRKAYKKL